MRNLVFEPNIRVGPLFFGTERTEVWKIMKWELGTEEISLYTILSTIPILTFSFTFLKRDLFLQTLLMRMMSMAVKFI